MLCEQCRQREATTHIRRVTGGTAEDHYLCAECARAGGAASALTSPGMQLLDLFSGLLGNHFAAQEQAVPRAAAGRCEFCGSSLREIAQEGRMGCARCYEAFYDQLQPTLRRVHGELKHNGKRPAEDPQAARRRRTERELEQLREAIGAAVREERYEEAARLRDEIRRLEEGGGEA
ncbi:MAG: UvrB/UvrC motif-containing protein [Oscillospiraceae bacterium]|nr:UvrB/UvrC motif-containing protein [Oscillospiraceae bacterium]